MDLELDFLEDIDINDPNLKEKADEALTNGKHLRAEFLLKQLSDHRRLFELHFVENRDWQSAYDDVKQMIVEKGASHEEIVAYKLRIAEYLVEKAVEENEPKKIDLASLCVGHGLKKMPVQFIELLIRNGFYLKAHLLAIKEEDDQEYAKIREKIDELAFEKCKEVLAEFKKISVEFRFALRTLTNDRRERYDYAFKCQQQQDDQNAKEDEEELQMMKKEEEEIRNSKFKFKMASIVDEKSFVETSVEGNGNITMTVYDYCQPVDEKRFDVFYQTNEKEETSDENSTNFFDFCDPASDERHLKTCFELIEKVYEYEEVVKDLSTILFDKKIVFVLYLNKCYQKLGRLVRSEFRNVWPKMPMEDAIMEAAILEGMDASDPTFIKEPACVLKDVVIHFENNKKDIRKA